LLIINIMMDLVKKTGSLKLHYEVNDIIAKVSLLIKEIPEFQALKFNHDLTLYVLNMIKNLVKSTKKIDVKAVAVQVISKVYNLTEEEVNILVNQIDYLISSKAVKKIASSTIAFNYVKKKVLNTSS
jgi:hypothetical protein